MKRLLARPARSSPQRRKSRKALLIVLLALIAAVVLALTGWMYADTAQVQSVPVKQESNFTDYGYLANVVLANEIFPTNSLLSQLKSYVVPNAKRRSDTWQHDQANASCPVKYTRLKYSHIRRFIEKPYLLGGKRQPECINCQKEGVWPNVCQYLSNGPVCPQDEQKHFWRYLVSRAEAGAPGYEAMLTMTPCDIWPYLRGRTLWVAGDSISQEFMRALQCFMMEFWDMTVHDIRGEYLAADELKDVRERVPGGWCVHLPEATRLCHLRVNFPAEMVRLLPDYERLTMNHSDIVVFNAGLWLNDVETYTREMQEFVAYYQEHKARLPYFLWRDSSVQHFNTPVGNYLTDPVSWDCLPLGTLVGGLGSITIDDDNVIHRNGPEELELILEGGWRNKAARPMMVDLEIPLVETWNKTLPVWRYHHHYHENPDHNDCTHWCHPSPYQMWIYDTLLVLQHMLPQIKSHTKRGKLNFLNTVDLDLFEDDAA